MGIKTGRIGVAISTTGDEHRLGFLETCVARWDAALRPGDSLFVTVDGSLRDTERVRNLLRHWTESVYRVGRPDYPGDMDGNHRQGVAVNKNTGLELLMDHTKVEHLFLSDDDTWPHYTHSLYKHTDLDLPHSMVCWGRSRLGDQHQTYATWTWPRGVVLYSHRSVITTVRGMDERFGIGGHEHAEWSNRIHNAGLTPAPFVTPLSYALSSPRGSAHRAEALWHCEDMRKMDEPIAELGHRRKALTSIRRADRDWDQINKIMAEREGSSEYVPFRAHQNGRSSATLGAHLTGQGGCAVEPAEPEEKK